MNSIEVLRFQRIEAGAIYEFSHHVTGEEVDSFARLSGDQNPLHLDDAYARRFGFRSRVVHGMWICSILSKIFGMDCPGAGVLWLSQNTRFISPAYVGDALTFRLKLKHKSEGMGILVVEIQVLNQNNESLIEGEGKVMAMDRTTERTWEEIVVLISGSSRGLGAAIARAFGQKGARVVVNYRSREDAALGVVDDIRKLGGKAIAVGADVTDAKSVQALHERVIKEFGRVDVLVNNASPKIAPMQFSESSWEEFQGYWDHYVKSTFLLSQAVIPGMRREGFGRIVNLLSSYIQGVPPVQMSGYVAAKSALLGLAKSMAVELGGDGITVNSVSPSPVITDQWEDVPDARRRALAMRNPMRRLATAEEVADAVVYLASPESRFINGANLLMAGGEAF